MPGEYDPTLYPESFDKRPYNPTEMPQSFLKGAPATGPATLVMGQADAAIGVQQPIPVQVWPSFVASPPPDVSGYPVLPNSNSPFAITNQVIAQPIEISLTQLSAPSQSSRLYTLVIKPVTPSLPAGFASSKAAAPYVRAHIQFGGGSGTSEFWVDASRGAVIPVEGSVVQVTISAFAPPPPDDVGDNLYPLKSYLISAFVSETQRTLTGDLFVTEPYIVALSGLGDTIMSCVPPFASSFQIFRRDWGGGSTGLNSRSAGDVVYQVLDATANVILNGELPAGSGTDMLTPVQLPSAAAFVAFSVSALGTPADPADLPVGEYVLLSYGLTL